MDYPDYPNWQYDPIEKNYDLYLTVVPKYYDNEQWDRIFVDKDLSVSIVMSSNDRYKTKEAESVLEIVTDNGNLVLILIIVGALVGVWGVCFGLYKVLGIISEN